MYLKMDGIQSDGEEFDGIIEMLKEISRDITFSEGTSGSTPPQGARGGPPLADRANPYGTPPIPKDYSRQRTVNGGSQRSAQRQRSYKRSEDEDKLKRSRAWANAYELSQDLHDKQLEMLERKYGGHLRARRAAKVIQQAYRQYCMNKNFEKLRHECEEKRLSRRFAEFGRSKTIWSDMLLNVEKEMGLHPGQMYDSQEAFSTVQKSATFSHSVLENSNQNIFVQQSSFTYGMSSSSKHGVRVLHKSRSLNMSAESLQQQDRKHKKLGLDLSTISESSRGSKEMLAVSGDESNNNRNSYPELNDSSASDSPQDTPVEPTVDLPSVNFENLLESKETDILNDSFHDSDSSQEHVKLAHDNAPKVFPRTYEKCSESPCADYGGTFQTDVQIHVEDTSEEAPMCNHTPPCTGDLDRTPTADDPEALTRIYCDTQVRLRKKKGAKTDSSNSEDNQNKLSGSNQGKSQEISPIWKRKSSTGACITDDPKRMSNISEASEPDSMDSRSLDSRSLDAQSFDLHGSREGLSSSPSSDTASMGSFGSHGEGAGSNTYHRTIPSKHISPTSRPPPKMTDKQRKRMYRIGLNLFNKKPEKGVAYLMERRFIENRPSSVAKFLISRKGISKQMIGEYLGNLQMKFNMEVLKHFTEEIDLSGLQVDMALRKFQSYFRMPGEAQKIERLMEAFASRYCQCNPDIVKKFHSPDTVFLLAFAIIMLNTDLHNKSIKPERRMKISDFVKNLRGIDDSRDIDSDLLSGIYERIKQCEFKPGADHVCQVMKLEQMIVGKKPQLALPHRRLVCYCRLYEVHDPNKKEKLGLHQREVFLFNDMLMITKIFSKKKNTVTYSFRQQHSLCGMLVYLFETPHYKYGISLKNNIDGKVLITFNARNENDRSKFIEDLKEAVVEMNEMESLRISEELNKQNMMAPPHNSNRYSKDSGVVDIDLLRPDHGMNRLSAPECGGLKKNTLSNSLIDLSETAARRGSGGSLDSGMVDASTGSGSSSREDNSAANGATGGQPKSNGLKPQTSSSSQSSQSKFGIFSGKKSKSSKSSLADCSEV